MRRTVRSFPAPGLALALGSLLMSGCGTEPATVSGRVTYNGKPVTNGSVVFYCADKQIVRGLIGPDGRYSIPNVPPGTAAVTVQAHAKVPEGFRLKQQLPPSTGGPIPPTADPTDTRRPALPARYALPEESGLSVTIGGNHATYDIDLNP